MKTRAVIIAVAMAAGVAAGFVAGRKCAGGACESGEPQTSVVSDDSLDKAKARIAELEVELADAKKDAKRAREIAARTDKSMAEAIKKDDGTASLAVGTNTDVIAELKRRLPETEFVAATNAMERLRAANAERARDRREYLASLDVSGLSAKEQENHRRFLELFERRENAMAKMKSLIPDEKTIGELMEVEMQMMPLAKQERKALLGALTKELGYTGEDGAVVSDSIEGIIDCTSPGMLGGLGDIGGLMEGADVQPGVHVETRVLGL